MPTSTRTRTPRPATSSPPASKPFALIFGCADSRVAAEIIFDQGLGDLFIVRTAGRDFLFRSKLPMAEDDQLGKTREFWKLIEQGEKTRKA